MEVGIDDGRDSAFGIDNLSTKTIIRLSYFFALLRCLYFLVVLLDVCFEDSLLLLAIYFHLLKTLF